jgi:hypothetical protein
MGVPLSAWIEIGGQTALDRAGLNRPLQLRFGWLGVAGVPLIVLGIAGYCLLCAKRTRLSGYAFSIAAVSMIAILAQFVAPELDRFQAAQLLSHRWRKQLQGNESHIAVLGYFRPTMVFYFGRDIDFCNSEDVAIRVATQGGNSIVVTTDKQYAKIKDQLPKSTEVIERVSQFPNRGELLVLGDRSLKR